MKHKKLRRLYAEEPLQVRRRGGRKRALSTRAPMTLPQGPPAPVAGLCFGRADRRSAVPHLGGGRCDHQPAERSDHSMKRLRC